MGDVIMSVPAFRALKQSFKCKITLLTSRAGAAIAPYIAEVDDVIAVDLPWVKTEGNSDVAALQQLSDSLKKNRFDGAIIFTVYSQSALPAALMLFQAGIPLRLAYARENPYGLLTDWFPDVEPYQVIHHQVERDLALVRRIGAHTDDDQLRLCVPPDARMRMFHKLEQLGIGYSFVVVHPGVSEARRAYPVDGWIEIVKELCQRYDLPVLITGSAAENKLAVAIADRSGGVAVAGAFELDGFIALVEQARVVLSVNTATCHIAAAVQTPVVVMYALTNPQHTPWKVPSKMFYFPVPDDDRSSNEVVRYVYRQIEHLAHVPPSADEVVNAAAELMKGR